MAHVYKLHDNELYWTHFNKFCYTLQNGQNDMLGWDTSSNFSTNRIMYVSNCVDTRDLLVHV